MPDRWRTGIIHLHSDYSHDGVDSLESLRDHGIKRGIGFVCMTDHAEDLDEGVYRNYVMHCAAVSDEMIRFIPGLEFRFRGYVGLHLLALGLEKWITPVSPEDFLTQTAVHAGFTIMAHPVYPDYSAPDSVLNRIHAIEVWNAAYNTRYLPDSRAMRMVHPMRDRRPRLFGVAGLDQHDASNDRGVRIIVDPGEEGDPLKALREGKFVNAGRTMSFGPWGWNPFKLAALSFARSGFDVAERIQHHAGRAFRGRS